jgi:hypothetical protein
MPLFFLVLTRSKQLSESYGWKRTCQTVCELLLAMRLLHNFTLLLQDDTVHHLRQHGRAQAHEGCHSF